MKFLLKIGSDIFNVFFKQIVKTPKVDNNLYLKTYEALEAFNTENNKGAVANLPYWDDAESLDVWDRTDVTLGVLIAELKSVNINVKIDASLTDIEIKELQSNIATQLKLDQRSDIISVTRLEWNDAEKYRNIKWLGSFLALSILGLLFALNPFKK